MGKKKFVRVIKTMAILLAVCLLVSLTAVAASAYTTISGETNDRNTIVIHDNNHRFGDHDNKQRLGKHDNKQHLGDHDNKQRLGDHDDKYGQDYIDGYNKGSNDGKEDCIQYGSKDFIRKIPDSFNKDERYREGFIRGYTIGYHEKRYKCLNEQGNKFYDHGGKYKDGDKYEQGYKDGYNKGYIDGKEDCIQYGSKDFIRKIPDSSNKDKRYREDFYRGYTTGYHEKRYKCLKND